VKNSQYKTIPGNGRIQNQKNNRIIAIFLCLLFILNLLQSWFTGLANDEAYYWMYSRYLAWGYFDHPPLVALLIKAGYLFWSNELGVRIMFCLLGTLTLLLTYKICSGSPWLFILITSAIVLVHTHVAGFLAIPDIPLVFFTALFFFLYKKYVEKDSTGLALLLGLSVTGMLYSKYHGLLVVFFVFLSNLSLVKRKSAWMMTGLVVLAMIPHLLWQIRHGFPTFQYHLVSRSDGFDPENILNYLYSQLLIAGPLIAPLVLYFSLFKKSEDLFGRSLKFTLVGFLVFFFLSSFRDHIEAHWTAAAFIPMIVMAHASISRHENAAKWTRNLAIPSIILIVAIRIMVAFNLVPDFLKPLDEFNGWKQWAKEIKLSAGDKKVVFLNKYQYAAKYSYYTGDFSFSMNDVFARKNQYNLWKLDDTLAGKTVLLLKSIRPEGTLKTSNKQTHGYTVIRNFQQYNRIIIAPELPSENMKPNDSLTVHCTICNPTSQPVSFNKTDSPGAVLFWVIRDEKGKFHSPYVPVSDFNEKYLLENSCSHLTFNIKTPESPGKYRLYVVLFLPCTGPIGDVRPASFHINSTLAD
jgi:hypothetical protein